MTEATATIDIVVGDYPHTRRLKSASTLADRPVTFPAVSPVHKAFAAMIRHQRYDACEMAIGAYLQARAEGQPLLLLPVVLAGGFQHANLLASPDRPVPTPDELVGRRVGVRSYSQTTGLWVRAILAEEFGVGHSEITWVTTEGSHAAGYVDPANVMRCDGELLDALGAGELAAVITSAKDNPDLPRVIPAADDAALAWYRRHGTVPINHMIVVTSALVEAQPEVVEALYREVSTGIDETRPGPAAAGTAPGVRYGREAVAPALALAAAAAVSQGLIPSAPDDINELFAL